MRAIRFSILVTGVSLLGCSASLIAPQSEPSPKANDQVKTDRGGCAQQAKRETGYNGSTVLWRGALGTLEGIAQGAAVVTEMTARAAFHAVTYGLFWNVFPDNLLTMPPPTTNANLEFINEQLAKYRGAYAACMENRGYSTGQDSQRK